MSSTAIVFSVCKGVTLHTARTGRHFIRLAMAPIFVPLGEIDMTKSLLMSFDAEGKAAVALDRLVFLMGDIAAQGLLHWGGAGPEEVRDRTEAACLNRCAWLSVQNPTKDGADRFVSVTTLSPEEAGAALRGGCL